MGTKIELERFNGKGDFRLWRRRMHVILVQQEVAKALQSEKKLHDILYPYKRDEILELAFNTLTFHLDDKVLREVSSEKTAVGIWAKLESLYMNKSLQDRIYLKGKVFNFKMTKTKSIRENLDEFNKLILDLQNIGIDVEDEDKAIIILNALPKIYTALSYTMKYARESLFFEDIQKALKAKESQTHSEK